MQKIDDIEISHLPIGDLRPDPANPRRISDEELESLTRSIREFGFLDPVIARREDKVVIGGHQRMLAARKLGHKTVPVVFVDLKLQLDHVAANWVLVTMGKRRIVQLALMIRTFIVIQDVLLVKFLAHGAICFSEKNFGQHSPAQHSF